MHPSRIRYSPRLGSRAGAYRTAGVDVKRTLGIEAAHVALGRRGTVGRTQGMGDCGRARPVRERFGACRFAGLAGRPAARTSPSRRPAARQSRDIDSPARSGAYAASLRDMNSVKSRTRFVLRVSPCVRSQSVPYMCRSAPGTLASRGSASPTKHGSVVIPSPCRTAAICASPSVVLNGIPVALTSRAQSGIPSLLMTIHRMAIRRARTPRG